MNIIRIIYIVSFLACSVLSVAQENIITREILDRTAEHLTNSGGITANFTTTVFQGKTPQDAISGTIDILGDKYVMKSNAISTWFNGELQWNMMSGNDEVTLVAPTSEELQATSPLAFITLYKQGFNLTHKITELRNLSVWEVTLKPRKKSHEPSVITISIDRLTYTPLCIRIRNNGSWTRISIKDFRTGMNFGSSHFEFPKTQYPHHEVIDMR